MSYLKLMKLLCIADRKALVELGRPITFDRFVSMKRGPVLSRTRDVNKRKVTADYWGQYISPPDYYELSCCRYGGHTAKLHVLVSELAARSR
jgi:hypothetical protein